MADLTSTVSIKGTVGGKAISYTHTYTLADVVDAGAAHGGIGASGATGSATDGMFRLRDNALSYVFCQNTSAKLPGFVQLLNNTAVSYFYFNALPSQIIILAANATNTIWTASSTATNSTLDDLEGVAVVGSTEGYPTPTGVAFGATIAAS